MFALSIIGGAIAGIAGIAKLNNNYEMSDVIDERFDVMAKQQANIYKNAVRMAQNKKVMALNTITLGYAASGFSTSKGLGAAEIDATTRSMNDAMDMLATNHGYKMNNLQYENDIAHKNLNLKYLTDLADTFADLTSYGKMANEYRNNNNDSSNTDS